MSRWRPRLLLLFIIALTAFSVVTVWPSEPYHYLPGSIPWPEGRGVTLKVPTVSGGIFKLKTVRRHAMSLGLDLRGGTRLVLEPEPGASAQVPDLGKALDGAKQIIEKRVNAFGVAESEVNRLGNNRIAVELPGIKASEAVDKIGRTALLEFCEPLQDSGGNIAVVTGGTVKYRSQTCDPDKDAQGNIIITDSKGNPITDGSASISYQLWNTTTTTQTFSRDDIVWTPAMGELNGTPTALTGKYLKSNTQFIPNPNQVQAITNPFLLTFEFNGNGAEIAGSVTERLAARNLPLATFLDGEPVKGADGHVIAPTVQSKITAQGQVTGLSQKDGSKLSTLLNIGAFPIPLRVIQRQDVDATLGETAVRDSVIAGEVALVIIMVFMILYYRVPGVMASLALLCYTSFVLCIFKLWPVTLTLAGVAAFVLSLGMAVDANILIFERMKEELRLGRNLVGALEDGFRRAWSSIRDSNVSTLITCAILYWFGNQFNESAIKGFAITLAIGVLVSLFSAITVTRTFMNLIIRVRPLSRRLWLFVPDMPEGMRQAPGGIPAMAGGSNGAAARPGREEP